jgi:hypothetical protein
MAGESRTLQRYDGGVLAEPPPAPPSPAPAPPAPPARPPGDPIGAAGRIVGVFIKLTLLLILVTALVGLFGLVGVGGRATQGVGERIGGALERGAGAVTGAVQAARDVADPAHPPREPLAQDSELDELIRLDAGATVDGSAERVVTFAEVRRRDNPENPDAAVYAVLRSALRTPRETRVLGMVVRTTRDEQEHYLYKGESFRLGRRLFKVNWVSLERRQMAIGAYRDPDRVTAPLKIALD